MPSPPCLAGKSVRSPECGNTSDCISKWREIREIRNQFAHEYPDDHEEKAANLNAAWRLTGELLETNRRVLAYARRQHGVEV